MKRLICAGLTLALLIGMCAAAMAGNQAGDVDGVYAKQLQEALEKGKPIPKPNVPPVVSKTPGDLPTQAQLTAKYGAAIAAQIMAKRATFYGTALENQGKVGADIINWALANGVQPDDIIKAGSFATIAAPAQTEEDPGSCEKKINWRRFWKYWKYWKLRCGPKDTPVELPQ